MPTSKPSRRLHPWRLAAATTFALLGCGGGGGNSGGSGGGEETGPPPAPGVAGPAWPGFGRDPQHAAQSAIATQDLNRIAWQARIDLNPPYRPSGALLVHYGSPVVTSNNTVVLPVRTGNDDRFRFEARSGVNGGLIWRLDTDYRLPPHNWLPSVNAALTAGNALWVPGAGGRVLVKDDADAATGAFRAVVFYGADRYAAAPATYDRNVYIHTPITIDAAGNAWFGFLATGSTPAGLASGIARIDADGTARWVAATDAASDAAIDHLAMNSAPALSADGTTLYVVASTATGPGLTQAGYLLALDAATLAPKARAPLLDPATGTPARISDDATASPTVGPDGDVYIGVLESTFGYHNGRGWLLHFDAALATSRIPGSFGWDITASVVPRSMVPAYTGASSYLLMTKYNDYAGIGSGRGLNRVAVLDPQATQVDPIAGGLVMREVLTIAGPTFESGSSGPVKEWCINTAAVDAATQSVLVGSEDGVLYRWHLPTNTFTQRIRLTGGLGEAYTPTAIGADGAVYAVNNATVFSIRR